MSKKVLLAMSGGIDSSVCAFILKDMGYDVTGITMKFWTSPDDLPLVCGTPQDLEDAAEIAKTIGIKHLVVDLSKIYKQKILNYFQKEYRLGKTPIPCAVCNRLIKFEIPELADIDKEYDLFATGHYAHILRNPQTKRFYIKKADDPQKDQSYFLAMLSQKHLARTLFPLAKLSKTNVREIAANLGLAIKEKQDSQDFKGAEALKQRLPASAGNIIDTDGNILGRHKGVHFYTVGQRKGLGIYGKKPLYVLAINAQTNEIVAGDETQLYSQEFMISNINFMGEVYQEGKTFKAKAKIRANGKEKKCTAYIEKNAKARIVFDIPEKSVTPGQLSVLYSDEDIILAGFID